MINMYSTWLLYFTLSYLMFYLIKKAKYNHNVISFTGIKEKNIISIEIVILFGILLFFAANRTISEGIGGTDAQAYLDILDSNTGTIGDYFREIQRRGILDVEDPLFKIMNIIFNKLGVSHKTYIYILYGLIIGFELYSVDYLYKEDEAKYFLSLLIYFYLVSFNIIRTSLSVSICMLAFVSICKKRWKKSFVIILCASMIHYMALAFFGVWLVCFLADKKPGWFKRKKLLLIAAVANIGSFVARKLLFAVIMQTKYSFYADYFLQDISIWGYLPGILICFFAVWMIKYVDKQDTRKYFVIVSLWVNLSLMYIIIGMLAWRINDYFFVFRVYALSLFNTYIERLHYKSNTSIYKLLLFLFFLALMAQVVMGLTESSGIVPYKLDIG